MARERSLQPPHRFASLLLLLLGVTMALAACSTKQFGPTGWSGLTGSDTALYLATGDGSIAALERQDGKLLWAYPPNKETPKIGAVYGTPVVHGDKVFVGTYAGKVYALHRSSGTQAWVFSTGGAIVAGLAASQGTLLVPSSDGILYALADSDGAQRWRFNTGSKVWSTPTVSDGVAYFGSLDHSVYAVALDKGELLWRYQTGGAIVGQPLLLQGTLFIGALDRTLYALDSRTGSLQWTRKSDHWFWVGPATDGQTLYASTIGGTLLALDPRTGTPRWETKTKGGIVAPVLLLGDALVVATDDKRLRVFSGKTGQEQWVYDLEERVRTQGVAFTQEGIIYVSDVKSKVRALNALRGTALWSTQLPKS